MKLSKLLLAHSPKIMIIPMIDIIFFLLVFFMMSTLYLFEQNTISVNLPQAVTAQVDRSETVPITVTAAGKIKIYQEDIAPELLPVRIQAELSRNPEPAFILRGDRQVEYGCIVRIMDELKKSGVRKIAVAAETQP